jgi:dual specificity MAP kinase phosphatase
MRTLSISSGALTTATFEPSEIIKDFLFLGPDITTSSEARYLREQLGIRRVLNAAWEIESGGGKHLRLDDRNEEHGFDGYLKLPIKDTVEETGVQGFIEEACAFLDEARTERAPTYVHCKAGKSRSVMLVMAYLIHANGWSLQRSYAHVVEQRRDVSPNIGFVAELMAFEEKRRRPQESIGGSTPGHKVNDDQNSSALPPCNHVVEQDRLRESPPPIDSSADAGEITPLARSFASSTLE